MFPPSRPPSPAMPVNGIEINVEYALKKAHRCRRRRGETPYPITYSKQMSDLDIWDHMFLSGHFRNITQHEFQSPPLLTLDIGCGSGFWAIEAARQWKHSKIIGFDMLDIQPHLESMELGRTIAQRVEWVHGNLLDGLPFPANHFNFVRMAGMGLAIPEDEWQPVLEEIHRVMKPGAVLEIIIEDLIFPSSSAFIKKPKVSPTIPTQTLRSLEVFKKSPSFSDRSSVSPPASPLSPMPSIYSVTDRSPSLTRRSSVFQSLSHEHTFQDRLYRIPSGSTIPHVDSDHPQDHTRLVLSWDAMLATRFLSHKVVAVIPFYLTTSFSDTKSHAPLVIPLPPNSGNVRTLKSYQSLGSFQAHEIRERTLSSNNILDVDFEFDFGLPILSNISNKADGCSLRSSLCYSSKSPTWCPVHMAKAISTIRGCKEAIWKEYEKLYARDAVEILLRRTPYDKFQEEYEPQDPKHLLREAFEVDWNNWECDMLDRTGMRDSLAVHIPWIQAATEDEMPPHMVWRKELDPDKSEHLVAAFNPNDICRSLRVFTAKKNIVS